MILSAHFNDVQKVMSRTKTPVFKKKKVNQVNFLEPVTCKSTNQVAWFKDIVPALGLEL